MATEPLLLLLLLLWLFGWVLVLILMLLLYTDLLNEQTSYYEQYSCFGKEPDKTTILNRICSKRKHRVFSSRGQSVTTVPFV